MVEVIIMNETVEFINSIFDQVRPTLQADGGDIEFVEFKDGIVYAKMQGACVGCEHQSATLHDGIESLLLAEVPGVIGIELVE